MLALIAISLAAPKLRAYIKRSNYYSINGSDYFPYNKGRAYERAIYSYWY
ncbi:hypothetical protein CLAFUW4_08082 [Fulvia fulva]|uniref:Uncharacterized protein n=1 Tax=Passalora fulva TaxID=5499 RepID=A0A9Q8P6P3_PASFU|nr:uncharacterized protein CLAFUR5_08199 [Fulvia fulva]KAK4628885.1 hypothetical protein CLAFUR4_08087 [Fulvia fulva]KAK4629861.1 hypothetical protein CLAFUR0_08082 [Fulvia fulva]UJO15224.1 hypothetical protein CLAFUR5_08199 [Fulvia fulva]WPV12264.1 hypothetical protein CLAFUW4_08082 [Fulvia fulva]WPV27751.1 hypothetical protein CLAFUW7_08082 [Fulvia fulva]